MRSNAQAKALLKQLRFCVQSFGVLTGFGNASFVIGYSVTGAIAGPVGEKVGTALEKFGGGRLQVIKGLGVGFEKGQLIVEVGLRSPSLKRNLVQQGLIDASRKLWDWLSESTVRKVDDSFPN